MCFYIERKRKPKTRIAKKDIVCYKTVRDDYRPIYNPDKPAYRIGKMYYATNDRRKRIKELNLIPVNFVNGENGWVIDYGIHSYIKKPNRGRILEYIIPVGTEYLKNDTQYVSTKIKPIKEVK